MFSFSGTKEHNKDHLGLSLMSYVAKSYCPLGSFVVILRCVQRYAVQ